MDSDMHSSDDDAHLRAEFSMRIVSSTRPIGGLPVNFDLLGLSFGRKLKPSPRGPEIRSSKFSFLREVTPDEIKLYTPIQIQTILEQREDLRNVIAYEQQRLKLAKRTHNLPPYGAVNTSIGAISSGVGSPPGFADRDYFSSRDQPWIPLEEDECQFKCCHSCRPTCESRSYLSLDGIVNDDIPRSAASGYGFHLQGARPVMDASVVKKLGCRPVPLPRFNPAALTTPPSSLSSISSILDTMDQHIDGMDPLEDESDEMDHRSPLVKACLTPLPPPSAAETVLLHDHITAMVMEEEMEGGFFHKEPLDVGDGVAVLEESVGLAVPDVMMQV